MPAVTPEIFDRICERLAEGESLRSICRDEGMPRKATVFRFLADEANVAARDQYARAKEAQIEGLVDEMVEIADDGTNDWMEKVNQNGDVVGAIFNKEAAARSKLRLDARMWAASKMLPKKYGDKLAIGGAEDLPAIKTETRALDVIEGKLAGIASRIGTPSDPEEPDTSAG